MRRVPEPESTRWAHMSLYLRSKDFSVPGVWMEDYKFLAAYKLKTTVRDFYTRTHRLSVVLSCLILYWWLLAQVTILLYVFIGEATALLW